MTETDQTTEDSASARDGIGVSLFPVRYAETDAMGVVHHAAYLVYFEEGRSQFIRDLGGDYARIEQSGFHLPVTDVEIRFLGGLRYGQTVLLHTRLAEDRSRQLCFHYALHCAEEQRVLVTGLTRHTWTDGQGKVVRRPEIWRALTHPGPPAS